jgi:hypothetical protein
MKQTLINLLATDDLARPFGCALNPRLKQALEADLRFPAKAASPQPRSPIDPADFAENVEPLRALPPIQQRNEA